jgi:two-component system cell cycle sensor histidine kinase/response regulator CckA
MSPSVLIVEDERLVARELGMRLEEHGYRVTARVAAADEALRAASEQVPDLVLMDIRLEGERDGIETAELLHQRFDVPVIFLTAHSDDATVDRAKRSGAAGYLIKPPKERELLVAIEVALHNHEQARRLREREKLLDSTLRSVGEALVATDPAGNILFMNPAAESLTDWRAEDAVGQPLSTVVQLTYDRELGEPRFAQTTQRTGTVTDRAGRSHAVADSSSPIIDHAGSVVGGIVLLHDVTEERALARQREAAARLASLGALATGVAHEINNPLTWMIVNLGRLTEMLGTPPIPDEQLVALSQEALETLDGAERIRRVVRDLSAFAHRTPDRESCRVEDAIRQAVAASPSLAIEMDYVEATVSIAEPRLVRVLGNLLANAADAIGDAAPGDHHLSLRAALRSDDVIIEIADTGCGMDDEVRAHAFEPFFTTKPAGRGTGLGLSVAHGLVTAAGGSIGIASTPGRGTTVTLVLPLAEDLPEIEPNPIQELARILVVDDEAAIRKLLTRLLHAHEVEAVESVEALRRLREGARFDVIFCDVMMPTLDGVQLYEEIHTLDPEQARRIVFLTGGVVNTRAAAFLASTQNPILEKPFRPADVLAFAEGATKRST